MPPKNYNVTKGSKTNMTQRHCLVSFPSEGTHGIWPQHLIRSKGQFSYEAKFGKQWFACRVESEGIYLLFLSLTLTSYLYIL
jgi:hypothetical protein